MLKAGLAGLVVFAAGVAAAYRGAESGAVLLAGSGVSAPRVLHRVEAEYTREARSAHLQGTVTLQLVVDEEGRTTEISVISPLGFGLDEQAQAAVEKWKFAPGRKDGAPVKVLETVAVDFRLPGAFFDQKAERQRSHFNIAWETIARGAAGASAVKDAVHSMLDLCRQKFVPAVYVVGLWKTKGEHVEKNLAEGLNYIQTAASQDFAPALYESGMRHIEGRDLPVDVEKGFEEMRSAATLGSRQAQYYLADHYEVGQGVPRDLERAVRYYRLCAAQGADICQLRLAHILAQAPNRRERDYVEAVALFQLAAERGSREAKAAASRETSQLTEEQAQWVAKLKGEIVHK